MSATPVTAGAVAATVAPLPEGLEPGTPFSLNIVPLAIYQRVTQAISYRRLSRLLLELFGLAISEGALDAAFQRAIPRFDAEVGAILARRRRARVVCSDETSVRIDGRTCWNWVFQNGEVVIHVIHHSRGAGVVSEVMDGHRSAIWVSDLYGAQQGDAEEWQICLAHQLQRTERELDAVMALAPTNRDGKRLRKQYGKVRSHHGANSCEQVGAPLGAEAAGDLAIGRGRPQFAFAAVVVGVDLGMVEEGEESSAPLHVTVSTPIRLST